MNVRFTANAIDELEAARRWYEARSADLVGRFDEEIALAVTGITRNPRLWPLYIGAGVRGEVRFLTLGLFSYMLVFEITDEEAVVLAVPHLHERPGKWVGRRDRG